MDDLNQQSGLENSDNAPRPRRRVGRFIVAVLAVLCVAFGLWLVVSRDAREIVGEAPKALSLMAQLQREPNALFDRVGHSRVNILLIGEDYNWTIKPVYNPKTKKFAPYQVIDTDSPPRSDTMIVFSFDRDTRKVRMLSLPRDARVSYTDPDGRSHSGEKLNAVYSAGGIDSKKRQAFFQGFLNEEFGLRIDRVAVIKPNSFKKLVDMVGGVYVNVDGALKRNRAGKLYRGHIHYSDKWAGWEVDLDPGPQWLNGEKAHGYVRFRYDIEGDPGRIRRQQAVLKALARRIMDKPLLQIPGLVKQTRQQFRTDMDDLELGSAALFAKNLGSAEKIQPLTLFGIYASNGDIILNRPQNKKLLSALFGNSFTPERFLSRSEWTRRDDLGPMNNASPAAKEVLKEAGLLE